jgi:hypothetical protein
MAEDRGGALQHGGANCIAASGAEPVSVSGGIPGSGSRGSGSEGEAHVFAEAAGGHTQSRPRERYLQLRPLGLHDVPYHRELSSLSSSPSPSSAASPSSSPPPPPPSNHPPLNNFVKAIFDEARSEAWDISSWKRTGRYTTAKGKLAEGIDVTQLVREDGPPRRDTWFARWSEHPDAGLIRWDIFDAVLRKDHSAHEGEYTPNVFDTNTVLAWRVPEAVGKACGMKDVSLEITNMYHGIPAPLNDRVFTVLVLAGVRTDLSSQEQGDRDEFVVVQLPVDLTCFPEKVKKKCHHQIDSMTYQPPKISPNHASRGKVGKKLVQGEYASVEKVTRIVAETAENGTFAPSSSNVWTMATASNAKGVLPMWVQKKAVPGEIVKDVEYVYGYIDTHKAELEQLIRGRPKIKKRLTTESSRS